MLLDVEPGHLEIEPHELVVVPTRVPTLWHRTARYRDAPRLARRRCG
jgi:hypothetical protein